MFARFFIDRPIFAAVLSILITLAGALAVGTLPIAQYPNVTPPTIQVECNYPGASANVVAETIASPVEQQVNGVQDMLYMSSQSTNDGSYALTVTFKPGVDLNLCQVLVQNRVNLAIPQLPDVVRQTGVTTKKRSPEILLAVSVNSPDGTYDQLYLSNFAVLHCVDELARLPGIGEVRVFGQRDYSMRLWLDPNKLAARDLAVNDVLTAIRSENLSLSVGQIGQPPTPTGQSHQVPITLKGRLVEPADFENVVLRSTKDGRLIRLRDVARVEVNAKSQDISNRYNSKPTVGIAIFALPDANALATRELIARKMDELSRDFPTGVAYEIGYDTTPFIGESIDEVFKSLRDAVILVAIVVLVFLQGWRAALIPLIAVPVAIIGTFAAMYVAGFSINNLTLFGLVLAIGIVVDDAIVVVEAVEHHIEEGHPPREAAYIAMGEVSSPVVAVALVLSSVFIPCAFISGIIGSFFRQFALTIAISTILSMINSLTLSPALAAILLTSRKAKPDPLTWVLNKALGWFFKLFNKGFDWSIGAYTSIVARLLRFSAIVLLAYAGLVGLTAWGYRQLPTGFIPEQDKGYLIASVQLPDAASQQRTNELMAKLEKICRETPGIRNVNAIIGNNFLLSSYGSNFGSMFIILDPFAQRHGPKLGGSAIRAELMRRFEGEAPEALVNVFMPPAVSGLGRSGGFGVMMEDVEGSGPQALQAFTDQVCAEAKADQASGLVGTFTVYKASSPQLYADINRDACLSQGLALGDVFGTLQTYLGSRYINDFNLFGRTWQVVAQADTEFRDEVNDVKRLKVRNSRGLMVPLGSVATVKLIGGPLVVTRYNLRQAAAIRGGMKPGVSSGQGIANMEAIIGRVKPPDMSFEWTEITYLEKLSKDTGMLVFAMAVIFVFLVLAALYESWALPLAVILVVPMCVLGSIAGVAWAKQDINVFTQVGFVVLIGLASKNAILIVEFARAKKQAGMDRFEATLEACKLRLRPIMMTSFAFILGVVPLAIANGAGAEMRRALGVAVFAGMLGVTFFGIFLTPVFFYVIEGATHWHVFRTGPLATLGRGLMDLLTLKPMRQAAAAGFTRLAEKTKRRN